MDRQGQLPCRAEARAAPWGLKMGPRPLRVEKESTWLTGSVKCQAPDISMSGRSWPRFHESHRTLGVTATHMPERALCAGAVRRTSAPTAPRGSVWYYSPFTDKETEARGGQGSCREDSVWDPIPGCGEGLVPGCMSGWSRARNGVQAKGPPTRSPSTPTAASLPSGTAPSPPGLSFQRPSLTTVLPSLSSPLRPPRPGGSQGAASAAGASAQLSTGQSQGERGRHPLCPFSVL